MIVSISLPQFMVIIIFALLDVLGEAPPELTSESDAFCFLFSFFNFMFYCYLKRDIYKEIRIKKKHTLSLFSIRSSPNKKSIFHCPTKNVDLHVILLIFFIHLLTNASICTYLYSPSSSRMISAPRAIKLSDYSL